MTTANGEETPFLAECIVLDVLWELSGRAGWDGFWDGIDPEIRYEIQATLTALVQRRLNTQE